MKKTPPRTRTRTKAAPAQVKLTRTPGGIGRIPVTVTSPIVNNGAYPVKCVEGEQIPISAHVFREGHDCVAASVILTSPTGKTTRVDMTQVEPLGLDIYEAQVRPDMQGDWTFRIEGWSDPWHTWLHRAHMMLPVGVDHVLVITEGRQLLSGCAKQAGLAGDTDNQAVLEGAAEAMSPTSSARDIIAIIDAAPVLEAMAIHAPRELVSPSAEYPIRVDRKRAAFCSWYEFFPRSQGARFDEENQVWISGTFDSSHERLEAAAAMGFDVVYLPPIHPIGSAFRKGRNNSLDVNDLDPGSPWAIGSPDGGHDAIHPDLGDFVAFDRFVAKAKSLNLEIALDFALQASPDHPWVKEHPEWFTTRVDGTIAYAENPPKKYQDIYPINFDNDPVGIYHESLRLLRFWIDKGVTIFRVDNPHTKPVDFWDWLLTQVHYTNPEVVFLAEAFTRPQMMHALGKIGFHQSYTYFTWRNTKWELETYLRELSTEMADFYRPSFWVNTPDINPLALQSGDPAIFSLRAILAATMSPSWGVYSGFELFEHIPFKQGGEEYLNSEKYEYRPRNFNQWPNLNMLLGRLNEIRRAQPALQQLRNVTFHHVPHDSIIAFSKVDKGNHVLVVANLNARQTTESEVYVNYEALGLPSGSVLKLVDQLSGATYEWSARNYVRLSPDHPAHIFQVTQS